MGIPVRSERQPDVVYISNQTSSTLPHLQIKSKDDICPHYRTFQTHTGSVRCDAVPQERMDPRMNPARYINFLKVAQKKKQTKAMFQNPCGRDISSKPCFGGSLTVARETKLIKLQHLVGYNHSSCWTKQHHRRVQTHTIGRIYRSQIRLLPRGS